MSSTPALVECIPLAATFLISNARKAMAFAAVFGMTANKGRPAADAVLERTKGLEIAGGLMLVAARRPAVAQRG